MTPSFLRLGWRSLVRDLRSGDLRLLIVSITLAVAALTAVGFFADRLKGGLARDARQLLGGDAIISSDNATPPEYLAKAQALGLQFTRTIGFPTMSRAPDAQGGASKLVAFKAVEAGYPLRGNMVVQGQAQVLAGTAAEVTREIPAAGEAWADAPVLEVLGLKLGDSVLLGDSAFRLTRIIALEPDRGGGFINFAPRIMVNQADLAATQLVQPASRLTYRLAVAGEDAQVAKFVAWAQAQIKQPGVRGVRLESLESGRPEVRQTLDRAEKFLNLVALLAALLSAVAVALAARGFAASHLDDCAMLRVLGQRQRTIALAYSFEFVLVGVLASAIGLAIGFAVHYGFVFLLAGLVTTTLPAPSIWPLLFGLGMGLTLLLAFGLPPVLQLAQVPPLRVIRRDLGGIKPASVLVLAVGVAGFATLLLAASSDLQLGLIAVGGFAGAVLLFAALSWLAVKLLRSSVNDAHGPRWLVLATRQITARPAYAVVQVSALAVGLLALILLVLLRTDLIASWRQASPPDAPNRFVINVLPEQGEAFQSYLRQSGVAKFDWYPMIRGRLIAVNGKAVSPDDYPDDRAKRLLDREFNLSHSLQQPDYNQITAGQWVPGEQSGISMEEGLAGTLGLKLGDQLRFDVAGTLSDAKVTSIRKVDWASLRVNFFFMYPLAAMPDMPITYISAFKAPGAPPATVSGANSATKPVVAPALNTAGASAPASQGFDNQMVRQFPNITSVDTSATILQIQRVLDQVIAAVEFLFAFTLAAGMVVLFAAVTATREERAREYAIMRAVGARASLLRQVQRAELIGVGVLAGVLASIVASAVGWALAKYVFQFTWAPTPWVVLLGALAGGLLALAAGWWGLREVLRRPVVETLRRAAQ